MKDTTKIETICAETKEPILVTKNGYGKLVVMDLECFEILMNQSYEAKLVNEGIAELEKGKVIDGNFVMEELRKKYGL